MAKIENFFLGDNPFFGVDHLSQERARKKASTSQNFDNALNVIKTSFEMGANGMVVSARPKLEELIEKIKNGSSLIDKINFYPILLSPPNYMTKINEKGLVNSLMDILNQASFKNKLRIISRGGIGIIRKDLLELLKIFIDLEMIQLQDLHIKTVFLHETIMDLSLSLDIKNILEIFQEHIHDKYGLESGLVTKNFSKVVDKLDEWNVDFPKIMTSFNKVGFQMNPSKEECEKSAIRYNGKIVAMSVLAAGYLSLNDAYEYILSQPKINTVTVGISSVEHAKQTLELFMNKNSK
ncbi:MAG: hypothetical protein KGL95_12385 [Patescibacteria group bacterium]|nr:hypothetical protein [Patescibacteria group bacterium]